MFRRDYVANSNDSYWLANPEQPLEGFARIIGDERTERSLRERLGLTMLEQRLAGTDGYAGDKFSRQQAAADRVQRPPLRRRAVPLDARLASVTRNPIARQLRRRLGRRRAPPARRSTASTSKQNLDSTGAILFRRFMSNLGAPSVHDAVRRRRPGQHAVRARHLRPRRSAGARRRGHRPQRRRDPVRRAAGPVPVRAARGREHPDPRRPRAARAPST